MQDATSASSATERAERTQTLAAQEELAVVSTHVLVPEEQVVKLRELSRRSRIAQSEYLREAVDDLLAKYGCVTAQPSATASFEPEKS